MGVNKNRRRKSWGMAAIISWVLLVVLAAGWRVSALAEDAGPPPAKTNTKTNIPGMSIEEAILLALRHNRTIQSAYLDRVAQKFDLKVAEDEFYPNLELISSFHHNDSTTEASTRTNTVNDMEAAQITLSESLPTGGTLTFSWENALDRQITDSAVSAKTHTQTGALALVQPLLKGGGHRRQYGIVADSTVKRGAKHPVTQGHPHRYGHRGGERFP